VHVLFCFSFSGPLMAAISSQPRLELRDLHLESFKASLECIRFAGGRLNSSVEIEEGHVLGLEEFGCLLVSVFLNFSSSRAAFLVLLLQAVSQVSLLHRGSLLTPWAMMRSGLLVERWCVRVSCRIGPPHLHSLPLLFRKGSKFALRRRIRIIKARTRAYAIVENLI